MIGMIKENILYSEAIELYLVQIFVLVSFAQYQVYYKVSIIVVVVIQIQIAVEAL